MRKLYYKISEDGYPIIFPEQLEDGLIEYVEGEEPQELKDAFDKITLHEEQQKQAEMLSKQRDEAMLKGFVYNGMDISVTKDDGDGIVHVKASFELGLQSTVIHFANGTKLPMEAVDFPAFAFQFVHERGRFFQ